ncbi:MAG: ECF-type sigma factor [Planctomycetales bacterium]|nr:ECF-type sigma factor [Planctomycetales bacterium]
MTASEDAGELTQLLFRIQNSRDEDACAKLWQSVYERIVTYARGRIAVKDQRVADEEDIAQSAMKSFFRAAEAGRFRTLTNSDELWRILITVMARKSHALQQRQAAEKRGDGQVRGDSVFRLVAQGRISGTNFADPRRFVDELLGECRERIEALPDKILRTIAVKRMEEFQVTEIAVEMSLSVATIKRKLARIRDLWAADAP